LKPNKTQEAIWILHPNMPKNRGGTPNVDASLETSKPEIAPIGSDGRLNAMYSDTENPNES